MTREDIDSANNDPVKLLFFGDVGITSKMLDSSGFPRDLDIFRDTIDVMPCVDLKIANWETSINFDDKRRFQRPGMRAHSAAVNVAKMSGFDILCLCNNHTLDSGPDNLAKLLSCFSKLGIQTFGAGRNIREAIQPLVVTVRGARIGFVGGCDFLCLAATSSKPGVAPLNARRIINLVRTLRSEVDVVIVSIHADLEFHSFPSPWRRKFSRLLVDSGADLVVQHHPHVVQGIEMYRSSLIAYSLGNTCFKLSGNSYQGSRDDARWSVMLYVEIFNRAQLVINHKLIPFAIGENHIPQITSVAKSLFISNEIQKRSRLLHDEESLKELWDEVAVSEAKSTLWGWYWCLRNNGFMSFFSRIKLDLSILGRRFAIFHCIRCAFSLRRKPF